ncbi:MAG: hypothetical protein ACPG21_01960 [Crocinitomicaceae bacterium]
MLTILTKQVKTCADIYQNVNKGYYNALIVPMLLLNLIGVILSFFIEFGSVQMRYMLLDGPTQIEPIYVLTYSLNYVWPGVSTMIFGLFAPFFWSTIRNDGQRHFNVSLTMNNISHQRWSVFIVLLFVFIILNLFFYDGLFANSFLELNMNDYGIFDNPESRFSFWFKSFFIEIRALITFLFAVIIARFDQFKIEGISRHWRPIIVSTLLLIGVDVILQTAVEFINGQGIGLLSIFFENYLLITLLMFTVFFFAQIFFAPALFCFISGGEKIEETVFRNDSDVLIDNE